MNATKALRNVRLYYLFQVFREPLFWGAILITYIQRVSGMTLSDIYFMEAICLLVVMLLQVPTGALADLLGRRFAICLGLGFCVMESLLFAFAKNPAMIWAANLAWAIGFSLVSGADSSLLYDSLKILGREDEYKKIEGRSSAYRLLMAAACSAGVGYLAQISLRLPLYLGTGFMAFNFLAAFFFQEERRPRRGKHDWREHWDLMKISVLFVANHVKVKWVIAFVVIIGVTSKAWFFTYNPYFELVGLPLPYYGWLFCLLNLVAAVASHEADRLAKRIGELWSIIAMIALIGIPVYLMGAMVCPTAVLLVLCQNVTRGYLNPFMGHFLHRYLDSANRATVMSINSGARGLGEFLMLGAFGYTVRIFSLADSLKLLGVFTLGAGLILVLTYRRIFR